MVVLQMYCITAKTLAEHAGGVYKQDVADRIGLRSESVSARPTILPFVATYAHHSPLAPPLPVLNLDKTESGDRAESGAERWDQA
jgi:hypothetical protein